MGNEVPIKMANDAGERLLKQALDLWINPEIERRRKDGRIPRGFAIKAAQVIMNVGKPLEVRLNEENTAS